MKSEKCHNCLFGEVCVEAIGDCSYFSPVGEHLEDEMIERRIHSNYILFREEWLQYTEEYGD